VRAAVGELLADAEVVATGQGGPARRAREALQVEHQVTGPHHQLGRGDSGLAPRTPLHPEQPAPTKNRGLFF